MRLWDFSSSVNAHVQPSSGARCLIFGRNLRLLPYVMCANSEGSGETVRMRRLAWAFAGRLWYMSQNLMSWLILLIPLHLVTNELLGYICIVYIIWLIEFWFAICTELNKYLISNRRINIRHEKSQNLYLSSAVVSILLIVPVGCIVPNYSVILCFRAFLATSHLMLWITLNRTLLYIRTLIVTTVIFSISYYFCKQKQYFILFWKNQERLRISRNNIHFEIQGPGVCGTFQKINIYEQSSGIVLV